LQVFATNLFLKLPKMNQSLRKEHASAGDPINRLQQEITDLEAALHSVKQELGAFERQIQARLQRELARVQELAALYKKQKKDKKAKRLEQKKRGKNYREPTQLLAQPEHLPKAPATSTEEAQELKRLYKEAVVQVHPDKFMHAGEEDKVQRATSLTAQLNGIYKRGDLEELILFYQAIISGNTVPEADNRPEPVGVDPALRMASLKRKKETLAAQLEKIKKSYTYNVLITYENPLLFIDELYLHLLDRIKVLEKRTRKG
jgi:hypothetical protein